MTFSKEAERAQRAIKAVNCADDPETAIADLLADLMHLAAESELDWDELLARASRYVRADKED